MGEEVTEEEEEELQHKKARQGSLVTSCVTHIMNWQ
jgi:hypothetical protein